MGRSQFETEFENVVAAIRPELVRIAEKIIGPSNAEDAVQEACLTVWQQGQAIGNLRDYLRKATENAAKMFARSEERQIEQIEHYVQARGIQVSRRGPVVDDVAAINTKIDVHQALSKLPEDVRRAVWAIYAEGATEREVAEELGIPRTTLQQLVSAALSDLRQLFGPKPPSAASTRCEEEETK